VDVVAEGVLPQPVLEMQPWLRVEIQREPCSIKGRDLPCRRSVAAAQHVLLLGGSVFATHHGGPGYALVNASNWCC
jgi:hypothetical protein